VRLALVVAGSSSPAVHPAAVSVAMTPKTDRTVFMVLPARFTRTRDRHEAATCT
jgi:cysteine synthase